MALADDIRQYALYKYIRPARIAGQREVVFRAGDIHEALYLSNRFPAVSGAVGSQKFLDMANVDMWIKPPVNGANTEFHCEIL